MKKITLEKTCYCFIHEEKDLYGGHECYKAYYETVRRNIQHKIKQYEHHADELDQARDIAEHDENVFDQIAPGAQEEEANSDQEQSNESENIHLFQSWQSMPQRI